ncbi:DinB family protein [Tundrisphaera sp. TA3]|uniref:DinB family protein n=1 Tax=Tundrisphaera sp. TA3 TaxID=3435775 RepID=UPI003EBEAE6E
MTDDFAALFAFNRWADGRVIAACRALGPEDYRREPAPGWPSVHATLVHLAGSTRAWARRFRGEVVTALPGAGEVPDLEAAARLLGEAHDEFDAVARELTPERLAAPWTYRNMRGEDCTAPLWAALRHVVNHATYHRGQVASKLGRLGAPSPETDLIRWAFETSPRPS